MKKMKSNVFSLLLILILCGLLLYFTDMIPKMGTWYSYDQSLRLQTEAFLRGELAIQQTPYGARHDWIWGNGLQQCWGLGIPIIQLPFNFVSKLFGLFGFPDRLIFLIFYAVVAAILFKSLDSTYHSESGEKKQLIKRIELIPVTFFALLNPAFITMLRAKFGPYEEVIAYAYLWTFMCLALMYSFLIKPRRYLFFLLCLLSGFSIIFRPTHGAYGIMTFLTAFSFARQSRIKFYLIGIPLFLTGVFFFLATNYWRFGSPFEFGYNLQLLGGGYSDYMVVFDNPAKWYPFSSSAVEMVSALFFIDIDKLYLPNQGLLWQTNQQKWLELNFKPFDVMTLILLTLGWFVVVLNFRVNQKDHSSASLHKKRIIRAIGIWSCVSFAMLFLFYAQYPALIARYLVDFGPAIVIGIAILYWVLTDFINNRLPQKLSLLLNVALCTIFASWIFVEVSRAIVLTLPTFNHLSKAELNNVTTAEIARENFLKMQRTTGPALPDEYRCGDKEYNYDITYNNINWDISDSCAVALVSTHFLNNPRCLALDIEPVGNRSGPELEGLLEEIEIKVGIEQFQRKETKSSKRGKTITYCTSGKSGYENTDYVKYKLVKIKWIDLRKHLDYTSPPIRLIALRKIN